MDFFIELGFNDTSTLVGHFVLSPKEWEKRDRRDSREDEKEGQGRKRKMKAEKQKKLKLLNSPCTQNDLNIKHYYLKNTSRWEFSKNRNNY